MKAFKGALCAVILGTCMATSAHAWENVYLPASGCPYALVNGKCDGKDPIKGMILTKINMIDPHGYNPPELTIRCEVPFGGKAKYILEVSDGAYFLTGPYDQAGSAKVNIPARIELRTDNYAQGVPLKLEGVTSDVADMGVFSAELTTANLNILRLAKQSIYEIGEGYPIGRTFPAQGTDAAIKSLIDVCEAS